MQPQVNFILKPTATSGKLRILFIDDEQALLETYMAAFGDRYDVTLGFGGRDGLLKFRPNFFDCVVCDRKMPDMDGEKVVRAIKRMDSKQPVIMVAVDVSSLTYERKAEIGADLYLDKPVKIDDLRRAIDSFTKDKV